MKLFLSFIALLFLSHQRINSQTETFEPEVLKADFDFLLKKLDEIHPDPYANISQIHLKNSIQSINTKISDNKMSKLDFWKTVAPLITSLKDGHTELVIPKNNHDTADKVYFPGEVMITEDNKLLLITSYDETLELINPIEITSVNGKTIASIINSFRDYVSTELESFQNILIEKRFREYLISFYGTKNRYEITYIDNGVLSETSLSAISKTKIDSIKPKRKKSYSLYFKDKSAVLEINSFSGNLKQFKKFLKISFDSINSVDSERLLIDISENGGGDSRFGNAIINHIYTNRYAQVDSLSIKSSKATKKYFKENYFGWMYNVIYPLFYFNPVTKASFTRKNGKTYSHSFKTKKPKNKEKFTKDIYLITSNKTYSSAHIFANAFNCYDMGHSVGMQTGGTSSFFGDVVEIKLPNTKIVCQISFKKFHLPCSNSSIENSKPDIPINKLQMIKDDKILEIIKTIKQ